MTHTKEIEAIVVATGSYRKLRSDFATSREIRTEVRNLKVCSAHLSAYGIENVLNIERNDKGHILSIELKKG